MVPAWYRTTMVRAKALPRAVLALAGLAVLPLLAGAGEPRPGEGSASPILVLVSPRQRAADLVARFPENTDLSESYFGTAAFSVHLHIMGPSQFCPLHLHQRGHEAALIVEGTGLVRNGAGGTGKKKQPEGLAVREGDLVVSPPGSSHAFINTTPGGHLATLVVSALPFSGNLYLEPDDPRCAGGPLPMVERLGSPPAGLTGGGSGGVIRKPIPFNPAVGLTRLDLTGRQRWTLKRSALFYVAAGVGRLEIDGGGETPLEPGLLVGVKSGARLTLTPGPGAPLSLAEFDF